MPVPSLAEDELVDDRALRSLDDDKFGHSHVVAELAALARRVPTPANVALYAPWGSGKTGLARVLCEEFRDDVKVAFVHFDALKYAEAPLRRQFLSQLAGELGLDGDRFSQSLYGKEVTNTFSLPKAKLFKFIGLFLLTLVGLMSFVLLCATTYALFADNAFARDFRAAMGWLAPKAFLPASLLAVLAAFAGKELAVERTVEAPASDEEFESAFRGLVDEAVGSRSPLGKVTIDDKKKRLVVFVDELDRCTPSEVASTLETIRTFLEVEGCLFIIAADQQALEEALSRKVKQATPSNANRPYYSAGSAYLDKVFQYQLSLPPLKPQRLTNFALGLVDERAGVWARIRAEANLADVVSVLVPTHVSSPRRVKALLNNFALLYRLAEQRADAGYLAGDVASRALELAKLACLRLEFPLFAADLTVDTRMPALVDALASDREDLLPVSLRPEVKERAEDWAESKRLVDELLSEDNEGGTSETTEQVRKEHAAQLLRYLSKTRRVPGPGRDLIHMESAAATLSVPIEVADELETEAVDGNRDRVREIVRGLSGAEQLDAYKLLANVVRHSAVGIEGENAVGALLGALADHEEPLTDVADELASAIAGQEFELSQADHLGAFDLSLESSHEVGAELRAQVLQDENALTSRELRLRLVAAADQVLGDEASSVGAATAGLAMQDPDDFAAALVALPAALALGCLEAATGWLETGLEDPDATDERFENLRASLDALIAGGDRELFERFAAILLAFDLQHVTDLIDARLGDLGAATSPELTEAILAYAEGQQAAMAMTWLGAIEPSAFTDAQRERAQALVGTQAATLWSGLVADPSMSPLATVEDLKSYVKDGLIAESAAVSKAVSSDFPGSFNGSNGSAEFVRLSGLGGIFATLGFVSMELVSDLVLGAVVTTAAAGPTVYASAPFTAPTLDLYRKHLATASPAQVMRAAEMTASAWPETVGTMRLLAMKELSQQRGEEVASDPYTAEVIEQLVMSDYETFNEGLAAAIDVWSWDPAGLWQITRPFANGEVPEPVRTALKNHVAWLREDEDRAQTHRQFIERCITGCLERAVAPAFLRTAGLALADPAAVANHMVHLWEHHQAADPATKAGQLFGVWAALSPGDVNVQRALVNGIYGPVARTSDSSHFDVSLEHLPLLKHAPYDRRDAVRQALRKSANVLDRIDELEARLDQLGWKKRKGRFGLGGKQDA